MTVRREITTHTGRDASLGAVYATLDRLERKGWISSRGAAALDSPERGGRARRFFRIDATGEAALQRALDALDRMRTPETPTAPTPAPALSPTAGPRRPRAAGAAT